MRYVNDRTYADDGCSVGRGVRARVDIAAGDVVEICPVVIVAAERVAELDRTELYDHYYRWADGAAAVALGCGSLYNHSATPNAAYHAEVDEGVVRIVAVSDIAAGDEVTVDYTCGGTNPLWFTPTT